MTSSVGTSSEAFSAEVAPEYPLLLKALRDEKLARVLAAAPGGWRSLSEPELEALELNRRDRTAVRALQELVSRSYSDLPRHHFATATDVARVYGHRLGGLVHEVMLAVALDGRNRFVGELQLAMGGAHGVCVTARDVLRPLIRIGASAFLLVHNHPSGDPTPSPEDISFTEIVLTCADAVGMALVDHVVVAARGGGHTSIRDLNLVDFDSYGEDSCVTTKKLKRRRRT